MILATAVGLCFCMLTAAWIYFCGTKGRSPVAVPKVLAEKPIVPVAKEKPQSPYPVIKS